MLTLLNSILDCVKRYKKGYVMEAIIASILGGLVSGLFTFLGVWLTIRHENKKARQEELKRQKEKEEQLFENRPRLEIMGYKKLTKYSHREKQMHVSFSAV